VKGSLIADMAVGNMNPKRTTNGNLLNVSVSLKIKCEQKDVINI